MATELEQRLRDSLAHAAERFPPPPDLRDRVDGRLAAHDRRRRLRRLAAAAVVVVVVVVVTAAGVVLRGGDDGRDQRVAVVPGPDERAGDWHAATSSALGWRFEHPADWRVQEFSGQCRVVSGTVVTNLDRPLAFEGPPDGCTTSWDLAGAPAGFVAVEMSVMATRPVFGRASPDTAFPLSLDLTSPVPPEAHPPQAPSRYLLVTVGGQSGYRVMVWLGQGASADDLAAAGRIVASIRPSAEAVGSRPPAPAACPDELTEPSVVSGRVCAPEAPAGNGLGEDGRCTGEETVPPCGPGVEVGRYYPYTLPLRCDGIAHFDGRRWVSGLPPPADGGTMHVWMRLDPSGNVGLVSPRGVIGFEPDTGQAPEGCRGPGG